MKASSINKFYTEEDIYKMVEKFAFLNADYIEILDKYFSFIGKDIEPNEYICHGFLRRLDIVKECIHEIFIIFPPERNELLDEREKNVININLHAFYINIFGCIDNLAHAFCRLKKIPIEISAISFINPMVQEKLKTGFKKYLKKENIINWYKYVENYRHSLAHRIPVYCPGEMVIDGQGPTVICPIITHSFYEKDVKPIKMHPQLLADWATIVEVANKFYEELIYHKNTKHI